MSKRGKFMGMEVVDLDKGESVKGSLKDKIEESNAEKSPEEKSEKKVLKGKVFNCDNLNLREADNQVSKIIKILPKGTELEICEEFGKWYRVKVNGYDGYVMAQYVEVM
jgi:uncharacterized protein YgiM (DUF1202 family)